MRPLVLDDRERVRALPVTRLSVMLRLDGERPPELDRYGFYDGQWVHTPRPVVTCWVGPEQWWCDYRKAMIEVSTNTHRIEGRLILGGAWPMIETTLIHPPPKYPYSPRRLAGTPEIFTVRDRSQIADGRLGAPRRVLQLGDLATGCTTGVDPASRAASLVLSR